MMGFRAEGPEESVCDTCGSEGKNPNLRDGYCDDCVCSGCYDRPISGSEYAYCERCYEKNNPSHENWDRSDYWAETFEAEDSADCSSCGENLEDYGSIQCSDCAEDGCGACSCSDCDRCDDCCLCKCSVCGDKDWQMTDTKEGNVCRGCYVYCFKCSSRQHPEGMAAHEICNSCAEDMNRCEACWEPTEEDYIVTCRECENTYCDWCSGEPENMILTDGEDPICRDCAPMGLNAEDENDEILHDEAEVMWWGTYTGTINVPTKQGKQYYANFDIVKDPDFSAENEGFMSEEGSTPVMNPMEFGEMANWRPMDGTPGLSKRKRAENHEAKCGDCGRPATHSARGGTMNRCDRCWPGDEFFEAPIGYNELGPRPFYGNPRKIAIDRWGNRRFIRRRRDGTYMKNVDVGRSIAMDRRRKSQTWAPPGFRDQGDGSPSLLERFRNRLRQ